MPVTLIYCHETGEWRPDECPANCPGPHEPREFGDDSARLAFARLLNTVRGAFDDLLDGDDCMDGLRETYEGITGRDIGY